MIIIILKMGISNITIISFLIVIIVCQKAELIINDNNIKNNWSAMENYLKKQTVLGMLRNDLSEQTMLKVFSMDLPKLEELYFGEYRQWDEPIRDFNKIPQVLTQQLIEAIFKSSFFPHLKVLNLRETNIDDRSLAFLDKLNLTTNISALNLQNCFIGAKGFHSLSNIQFNNLKQLNISDNLLVDEEAVDSLIAIICGKAEGKCRNDLQVLDIGLTNIRREGFIRLMKRLNPASLRVLEMRQASLIFQTTYNEGFNYSAFQVLAQKFSNLEFLGLQQSFVDDEVAAIFQNKSLPNLLTLNVAENHLSDNGMKIWITKQNMPNLEVLAINSNQVGDATISHIVGQGFELRKFLFGDSRISNQGFKKLAQLPTDRLEKLLIEANVPSQVLNDFFQQGDFPKLKQLILLKNSLLTNIFYKIDWSKLQKLQTLGFSECNLKDSIESSMGSFKQEKLNLFPSLKSLIISEAQLNEDITAFIIITVPYYFPRLLRLYILQGEGLDPATFMLSALSQSDFNQGMYVNVNGLELVLRGNLFQLWSVPSINFLIYSENQDDLLIQALNSKISAYASLFDYSTLTSISISSKPLLSYFIKILKQAQTTTLSHLRELNLYMTTDIEFLSGIFSEISVPSLRGLAVMMAVPGDATEEQVESVALFFEKFKNLNSLYMSVTFLNQDNEFILRKKFMDRLHFPRLTEFVASKQNLEAEQVSNFLRNHSKTLRTINLGNNFMDTQFLDVLAEQEMVLRRLNLQSTSFMVDQFAVLGQVDTRFLRQLKLSQSDLTNQHILAFLNQSNKAGPVFPKIIDLDLQSNDIRKQGLSALLATGMYDLMALNLDRNSNPQFINIMLTYPTRIILLEAEMVEIYGLQDNLNPKSARSIEQIQIKTKSFLSEDFQHLARLDFAKLSTSVIEIYNVYDCQVLANLLKINYWNKLPQFLFSNDQNGINSSCLANLTFESHALGLNIIDKYGTTYLPEFVELLLNTTEDIKYFKLINNRLPPSFFEKISKKTFIQLQQLVMESNYIGDIAARSLFDRDYVNLKVLMLFNVNITDITVEVLSRLSLPELAAIGFNQNKLGVRAVKALQNIKFLVILSLTRCGIDGEALAALAELQMPKLQGIYLAYNDFSGADLLMFASSIQRKSFPRLAFLDLRGIDLTKEEYDTIRSVLTPKSIQALMDRPHYVSKVNAARY